MADNDKGGAAGAGGAPAEGAKGADAGAGAGGAAAAGGEGAASFTVETFGTALKNPEVYADGKLFGIWPTFEEAAKGVKNLQGKLREAKPAAPETYDFSKVAVKDRPDVKFDQEAPLAKALLPVLKDSNISQDAAEKLVAAYLAFDAANIIDPKAEMAALGKDGPAMVKNVGDHVKTKAPAELQKDVDDMMSTAGGIRVLNWLLKGRVEGSIPKDGAGGVERKTAQEWGREAADYDTKHKATIGGSSDQQKEYQRLRQEEAKAKLAEEKAAKTA